ncbi:M23/M56 family metallopeptidase [Pseudomarimonas salicorniae]|uniref:M23/M56 family metallopeptidase n=1 Tax=Pseudomarimonas salicorniae TaxID=2933270 RepID=A0ABT0GCD1_9GAMM|nr:M23/M56 family metallopeptidase [Lysobacter sp. CAU 1642]MCK7592093.1 M23/M56 family metallopeptidase [Lysobacter sp. CAU 1642]
MSGPLPAEAVALLWQLGLSLGAGLGIALLACRLQRRLPWSAALPGFWWMMLAMVVLPTALARFLPGGWTAPVEAWEWGDAGATGEALPLLPGDAPLPTPTPDWGLVEALLACWLGGLAFSALRRVSGHLRLRRLLAECNALPAAHLPGPRSQRLARALVRRRITLLACPAPVSPFACRGRIVLPTPLLGRLDDDQCWLLLRHEATHLRLRDPFWHALLAAVVATHWFHPGVRLIADRLRLATELRCDARALGRRKYMRRAYAEAYLEALRMSATRALPCPAAAFSPQDQGHHKMRIGHILSSPAPAGKHRITALTALALTAAAALTAAQAAGVGPATPTDAASPEFRGPVIPGKISSQFGVSRPQLSTQPHRGVDLIAPRGTPVHAAADGVVLTAEAPFSEAPRYGSVVIVDHGGGWRTLYAHLDTIDVRRGESVRAGQSIGGLGSTGQATGPHVHLEVHRDGERVDPAKVIPQLVGAR